MMTRAETERAERIAEGVAKWYWSPDAACPNCGDRGRWPNSRHTCGCPAGRAMVAEANRIQSQSAARQAWQATDIPRRLACYRLDTAPDQDAAASVTAWLATDPVATGDNLLLTGPVGVGKTSLAVGALRAMHEAGQRGLRFAGVPGMLDAMRPDGDNPMAALTRSTVLVLDDLGAERASDWVRERLYVLVNARYEGLVPTIATTNRDLGQLAATLGERIVSRLAESLVVVAVDGPDRRRA